MPFQGIPLTVPSLSLAPYPQTPALLNQYPIHTDPHSTRRCVGRLNFVVGFMQQSTNGRLAPILIIDQSIFKEAQEGALDTILANASDITDDISRLAYRIGFLGLLNLFKEVNELNTKYTAKRFELGPWDTSFLSERTRCFIGLSSTFVKTQHLIKMRKKFSGPWHTESYPRDPSNRFQA
ncbi:hypothetical protein ElyMa_003239600 [Elysia marginata]|uniref:Uncharacterized protein n=1 Tax=Elysia marginata TaxID=1093978 RepID=A0AAV4J812_9GAST|nr:hypothetical protein ElyMa_003239600 [Elysia marginata]